MKNILSVGDFGAIDADNDVILFDCFEDHEAYENLINFRKFFWSLEGKAVGRLRYLKNWFT